MYVVEFLCINLTETVEMAISKF